MRSNRVRVFVSLSVLVLSACTDEGMPTSREDPISQGGAGGNAAIGGHGASGRGGSGGAAGQAAIAWTDDEIAALMQAANAAAVKQSTLAASQTETPPVRQFAVDLATAHSAANTRLLGVLLEQDISPKESAATAQLWRTSSRMVKTLRAASPSDFDTVYVQGQIDAHKAVLEIIDTKLLPTVKNAALKSELQTERKALKTQLQRAQELAKTLDLDVDAGVSEDGGT